MIPAEVATIVAGLISEPENPYVSTTLEELTSELADNLPLVDKIAFAAFEIYEALERERSRREQKTSHINQLRGAIDTSRGEAPRVGGYIPPAAFASGD